MALTWLAAAAVLAAGIRYGTFIAADTDPYGYVSEADLIAAGTLHVDQRFTLSLPWDNADLAFIPAGYKRARYPGFMVPTYPAGLPAVMAFFQKISGRRDAVFYAVPILGAVAVLATGMLGARVHGWFAGTGAAVLAATSAPFLLQVIQPVSDVPAMAWWTLALALSISDSRRAAFGAGLAASMAIVTRPNLVPLAAVIGASYLWRAWRDDHHRRAARSRLAIFALAVLAGCLAVALLNNALYGSPLSSGYAPFRELYRWEHVMPNIDRYPRWLLTTQTPFIYFGVVALWSARRRREAWLLFAFAVVVLLLYIPYGVFGRDEWGYLRFLLPAFPALLVLSVIATIDVLRHLPISKRTASLVAVACIALLGWWQVRTAIRAGILDLRTVEQRYIDVGRYAASMPEESVFIGALHAGSIRYYSGRLTMNYNGLHPRGLEDAVRALMAMGRRPYIVLEDGEEPHFRWVFDTYTELGRLDWPPAVKTSRGASVRIYDPADRARFFAGQPVATYDVDVAQKPIVVQH